MDEQPKSFWWKIWGRPRRFFAWVTMLALVGGVTLGFVLQLDRRDPNWSDFRIIFSFVTFCVVFVAALLGLILSTIPLTSRWMSWVLRRWFFCLAALVTLIALFYAEENWRGQRALDRAKRELTAQGVDLNWDKYVPPPVPAEQNVFAAPNMQEWFVGRHSTGVTRFDTETNFPVWGSGKKIEAETEARAYLVESDKLQPRFTMIRDALRRPYARMDGDYSNIETLPIPNFVAIRGMVRVLAQRAHCRLILREPEKAAEELAFMNDLRHFTDARPTGKPMTLVAAMINVAVVGVYTDVIGDGLQMHAWQEPQLVELQKQLSEINVMIPVAVAFETEPAASTRALETLPSQKLLSAFERHGDWLRLAPHGWIFQNIANDVPFYYARKDAFDVLQKRVKPEILKENSRRLEKFVAHKSPFRIFAAVLIPNINKAAQTTARNQNSVNEALIACALERYRIANGSYPDSLDATVPKFMVKLPNDIVTSEAMKYQRAGDSFVLYSIGWNEKDDGGITPATMINGQPDPDTGDWVWQFSPK